MKNNLTTVDIENIEYISVKIADIVIDTLSKVIKDCLEVLENERKI